MFCIRFKLLLITTCWLLLSACSSRMEFVPPSPDDEAFAPPRLDYSLPETRNGSLFRNKQLFSLFTDIRAFQVGDILMVYLDEETSSKKGADTSLDKSSSAGMSILSYDESVNAGRSAKGKASSSQANQLSGAITVTVYEVLPNGVLHIRGEKWITLNQGDEFIRLSGNVRVEDIDSNNAIASARVADARISYAGTGALADSNAPGWLMQLFTSPWVPL